MIGRCVAKDVHDGSYLLYPVQTGDRRTHHLSEWREVWEVVMVGNKEGSESEK